MILFQNRIHYNVADALRVFAGLPQRAFILQAAFFHHVAGMRIARIVMCCNAVHVDFFKQIPDHSLKRLGHDALVPPVIAQTITDFDRFDILPHDCHAD